MSDSKVESLLEKGLNELGLSTTSLQRQQLLAYLTLLEKWSRRINLTAVREVREMVGRHLLDSVAILNYLQGERLIDVGTGAGLPGIPLSMLSPDKTFFLLDSNQKKQIFVSHVVKSLSLANVVCIDSPVQAYQPDQKFSTIVTRAFAPLSRMIPLCAHLLAKEGCFLAMMGKVSEDLLVVPPGYEIKEVIALQVPGEKGQRHLAIIVKS